MRGPDFYGAFRLMGYAIAAVLLAALGLGFLLGRLL
jgi:hypothetical protein